MSHVYIIISIILSLGIQSTQPKIPDNARAVSYGKGWVCNSGYLERGNQCVSFADATDSEIKKLIVAHSVASYSGNCPCPYNTDRAGRRCGGRSAYSRPGGSSPMCYESDVTPQQVQRVRTNKRVN